MKALTAVLALLLLLAGCAPFSIGSRNTQSFRYYVLSGPTLSQIPPASGPRLGVVPITMPGYLNRPHIVTRDADGVNMHVSDLDRWGEDLGIGISRVLCESLTAHGKSAVSLRTGVQVDYRLLLEVLRLDGTPGKTVILDALWSIQKQGKILYGGHVLLEEPAGDTMESMVRAESTLVCNLGGSIAAAMQ